MIRQVQFANELDSLEYFHLKDVDLLASILVQPQYSTGTHGGYLTRPPAGSVPPTGRNETISPTLSQPGKYRPR